MIERMVTSPAIDLLTRTLNFTEQRHEVLVGNIANVDTPGYVQRDVSVSEFQAAMQKAIEKQRASFNEAGEPESTDTVAFESGGTGVQLQPRNEAVSAAYHDRGVRSVETMMTQLADNAQAHNMVASLLKTRFNWLQQAISMKA